jgi:hypothetical protein
MNMLNAWINNTLIGLKLTFRDRQAIFWTIVHQRDVVGADGDRHRLPGDAGTRNFASLSSGPDRALDDHHERDRIQHAGLAFDPAAADRAGENRL